MTHERQVSGNGERTLVEAVAAATGAYHVGFAVADLEATRDEMSELLHVEWAPVRSLTIDFRDAEGDRTEPFRYTFSRPASGACLVELIEGGMGSPWFPGEGTAWAFHHVAFWTPELEQDSRRLSAAGRQMTLTHAGPVAVNTAAYHQLAHSPTIELVTSARCPSFLEWIA